jgi:low temperature requirement protein LtrA
MPRASIASPADQRVTFVELFFDLVFVFAVTQVVQVFHHHPGWEGLVQAILVFWLVWWAWTQFTWALNAADTTHPVVELATLLAAGIAFFMAVALPGAFQDRARWFAIPYVTGRALGLVLYGWVAYASDARQHAAVRTFTIASLAGLLAVLVGAGLDGPGRYAAWGIAILLDVIAAAIGARQEGWGLHPEHFAERHGLFVIIALGESLIVAASGISAAQWTGSLLAAGVLAVAVTCALWWSYFPRVKPELDRALESVDGPAQSTMARDVFSLTHFPLLCGVIAIAAAVEEVLAHPGEPLPLLWRVTLAAGLTLFLGATGAAVWRAHGRVLMPRLVLTVATAAVVVLGPDGRIATLLVALAGVVVIAVAEEWTSTAADFAHRTKGGDPRVG